MAEQSLYRRHRPQSFADVVGQEPVVRTLSNAIERDRVHHAYLFVGSRGTGKTSMAKILARSLTSDALMVAEIANKVLATHQLSWRVVQTS